jgi:plastocyanin
MRRTAVIGVFAAGAGAGVVPALAADQAVKATINNKFEPATVTINAGEQVTFRNEDGYHNVHFADGWANKPSFPPWSVSRRFTASGRYPFACDIHGNSGMTGMVVVLGPDGSVPPPAPPPGTPPPPPPSPPPAPGAVPDFNVRAIRDHFCARRGSRCPRPGILLRVSLSHAATVSGLLERRSRAGTLRTDGRVRFAGTKGRHTVTILRRTDGRRIGAGEYRLALQARAATGAASTRRVLRFSVG